MRLGRLGPARRINWHLGRRTDLGIDLVAQHASGAWIAIQCKCYQESTTLNFNRDMSTFLAFASREPFDLRWFVATCPWGENAENAIKGKLDPPCTKKLILSTGIAISLWSRPKKKPRLSGPNRKMPLKFCKEGLANYDRGQMIMA